MFLSHLLKRKSALIRSQCIQPPDGESVRCSCRVFLSFRCRIYFPNICTDSGIISTAFYAFQHSIYLFPPQCSAFQILLFLFSARAAVLNAGHRLNLVDPQNIRTRTDPRHRAGLSEMCRHQTYILSELTVFVQVRIIISIVVIVKFISLYPFPSIVTAGRILTGAPLWKIKLQGFLITISTPSTTAKIVICLFWRCFLPAVPGFCAPAVVDFSAHSHLLSAQRPLYLLSKDLFYFFLKGFSSFRYSVSCTRPRRCLTAWTRL